MAKYLMMIREVDHMEKTYVRSKKWNNDGSVPKQEIPVDVKPKKIKSNLQRLPYRDFKILTTVFIFILIAQLLKKNKYPFSLDLNKIIKNPASRELLSAIIPYLDIEEQQNVYTILGLLEALDTIYGVADGTYQDVKISNTPILFDSEKERIVGILKAIKPYVPEPSRELVNNIAKAQTMSSQLARNIRVYKSKRLSGQNLLDSLDPIYDSFDTLRPIIPPKQYEQIDRIVSMAKLFESSELKNYIPSDEKSVGDGAVDMKTTTDQDPKMNTSPKKTDDTIETLMKVINLFNQASKN